MACVCWAGLHVIAKNVVMCAVSLGHVCCVRDMCSCYGSMLMSCLLCDITPPHVCVMCIGPEVWAQLNGKIDAFSCATGRMRCDVM